MPTVLQKTLAVLLASVIFQCLAFSLTGSTALAADVSTEVLEGYPPMPDLLYFHDGGFSYPVFIASTQIFTADGKVDRSLMQEGYVESFDRLLERQNQAPCLEQSSTAELHDRSPWKNLKSAVLEANHLAVVLITGQNPGFYGLLPGTLLRYELVEDLKAPSTEQNYLFLPLGDFSVGEARICARSMFKSSLPEIGDKVIIFFEDTWINKKSPITSTHGFDGIVTLRQGGGAVLPEIFLETDHILAGKSAEEILSHVRSILETSTPRK